MSNAPQDLTDLALDLLKKCAYCAGQGRLPYNGDWSDPNAEMVICRRCEGTGNFLDALLLRAYRTGRQDALRDAHYALDQFKRILTGQTPHPHPRQLHDRIGLRNDESPRRSEGSQVPARDQRGVGRE